MKYFSNIFKGVLMLLSIGLMFIDPVSGGVIMATLHPGVVTADTLTSQSPEQAERDMSQVITHIRPDDFPLDTVMRQIRASETAINHVVEYEELNYRDESGTINGAFTASSRTSADVTVDDSGMYGTHDILFAPTITPANGSGKGARLIVTAVPDGTTITIQAVNGHNGAGAVGNILTDMADNTVLWRLGNAKSELDSTTDQIYALPVQDSNNAQIQMQMIEQSQMEAKYSTYSGYNFRTKVEMMLWDYRSKMEKTHVFGTKATITLNGKKHYLADGIESKVTQSVSFTSSGGKPAMTLNEIIDMFETVYSNNNGSFDRLIIAGSGVISGLAKIDKYDRNIHALDNELYHGIRVKRLVSEFGEANIKYSKTLDNSGFANKAIILDLAHVFKHDLEAMHTTILDLDKAGQRRTQNAIRVLENSCLTIRYAGANGVHAIWE